MSLKKGKIFVVSAPSGSGKTTIVRQVLKSLPEIVFSVSATTRPQRAQEINGKDYFFIGKDEFLKRINDGDFAEWEIFYDYYYGTLKSFIYSNIDEGRSVLLEIDVNGALKIKETFPEALLIYISPPSIEELERRLRARGTETETDLKKRIDRAQMELEKKFLFDVVFINDNLEKASSEVYNFITNNFNGGNQ